MNVAVNFNNIVEVDEKKNTITVDLSLWLDWVDRRVKSLPKNDKEYVTVIGNAMDHLWIPDIYIDQVSYSYHSYTKEASRALSNFKEIIKNTNILLLCTCESYLPLNRLRILNNSNNNNIQVQ